MLSIPGCCSRCKPKQCWSGVSKFRESFVLVVPESSSPSVHELFPAECEHWSCSDRPVRRYKIEAIDPYGTSCFRLRVHVVHQPTYHDAPA